MSLEEFPPNREFVGRNFNAGEVIQLVLKAPGGSSRAGGEGRRGGRGDGSGNGERRGAGGMWLPFRHVQMVMMHELAHCKQMNHSGYFWRVRNGYAAELRGLWGRGYTGEGFWSRGQTLLSGEYTSDAVPDAMDEVAHLCGGTFRSTGRKRKRKREGEKGDGKGQSGKPKVSYAERKQRRILKKFGAGGKVLGDDGDAGFVKSENGKTRGKPRVASSKRGRELRAAAALARFENVKDSDGSVKEEETSDSGSSDTEDEENVADTKPAVDLNGKKLTDYKGFGLVKVCKGEEENDEDVKREMEELRDVDSGRGESAAASVATSRPFVPRKIKVENGIASEDESTQQFSLSDIPEINERPTTNKSQAIPDTNDRYADAPSSTTTRKECSVCSLLNEEAAIICSACSNVLNRDRMPDHWRCQSTTCREGSFINPGDFAVCALCGAARSKSIDG